MPQNESQSYSSNSTNLMLNQLALNTIANNRLIEYVRKLQVEMNPETISQLKQWIIKLVKKYDAYLLTPFDGSNALHHLINYYQLNHDDDALHQLVNTKQKAYLFLSTCTGLFAENKKVHVNHNFVSVKSPAKEASEEYIELKLEGNTLAEAVLATYALETVLYESFGIPFRSSCKFLPLDFDIQDGVVTVAIHYRPEDYLKIPPSPQLTLQDNCLRAIILHPTADFYDYCQQKYGIENTREMSSPKEIRSSLKQLTTPTMTHIPQSEETDYREFSARLLIVTRTGLGSGNYMNARQTIEGLCQKMPHVHIDWIIATDGDKMPETSDLPPQIHLYVTDSLWKLFPLIRSLSLKADLVASLPNTFLMSLQKTLQTQLILSQKSIPLVVHEYNCERNSSPYYLSLYSGINAGNDSLGIIHPKTLNIPTSIEEKRDLLCQDKITSLLFITAATAPLYFAYAYNPINAFMDNVEGLKIADILALFILHAKNSGHREIKIILPINRDTIINAMDKFPFIFKECSLKYITPNDIDFMGDNGSLAVEIFNLFPFHNTSFRLLMDYAAAHDTPVVVTGDQSLIEMFFTMSSEFTFIYQVLDHKKQLLNQLKLLAEERGLINLANLISHTEAGPFAEERIIYLSHFLQKNKNQLKFETQQLAKAIQDQPDLVASLARVINEWILKNRSLLGAAPIPTESSVISYGDGFSNSASLS